MDRCWCGNTKLANYSEHYYKCEKCHTLVAKALISYNPEEIDDEEDFYGKQYWETKMENAAKVHNLSQIVDLYMHERAVYWLKNLYSVLLPGQGHIAEVGCGLGQFSYLLKESGYIRNTLNIQIICGALKPTNKKFDAICAFDVMEHIIDPHEFLNTATSTLEADGFLMIQMPCYDEKLSYQDMLLQKPRFQEQLKENEHVYLYSKESAKRVFQEHGFNHVIFMDAFFGNDYDMFLIASKNPLTIYTSKEIDQALNRTEHGRLIKALISSWEERQTIKNCLRESEADRTARFKQIGILTQELKESEADRTARAEQIGQLTKQLQESEADRTARAKQMDSLTQKLEEAKKQIQFLTEESIFHKLSREFKEKTNRSNEGQEI